MGIVSELRRTGGSIRMKILMHIILCIFIIVFETMSYAEEMPWYDVAPNMAYDYLLEYLQIEPHVINQYICPDNYTAGRYKEGGRYYWQVDFYNDDTEYEYIFSVIIDEFSNKVAKISKRELFQQLIIQETTDNYEQWWNTQLAEKEKLWGPLQWWSYEQRAEFQNENYGWGIPGDSFAFSVPNEFQLSYDQAFSIVNSILNVRSDLVCNDKFKIVNAFIDYDHSNFDYCMDDVSKPNAYWFFAIIDYDNNIELGFILLDAYSGDIEFISDIPKYISENDILMYQDIVFYDGFQYEISGEPG